MNAFTRSRNGLRSLHRRAFRGLNHRCVRYATTLLGGARRPRQPDELRLLCRTLTAYLRLADRMAKRDPHLFGPHAHRYYLDTLALENEQQQVEAALDKVYGPRKPDEPRRISTLWTDRYHVPPKKRRLFLKWFRENYPDR